MDIVPFPGRSVLSGNNASQTYYLGLSRHSTSDFKSDGGQILLRKLAGG